MDEEPCMWDNRKRAQYCATLIGADVVKNEIRLQYCCIGNGQGVQTQLKLRTGFENNCPKGWNCSGFCHEYGLCCERVISDRQAERLDIPIEEFGDYVKSNNTVRIAGRCAVFAESDMIHKQQLDTMKRHYWGFARLLSEII